MKQRQNKVRKWQKIIGTILLLLAIGFFCLQMGYLFIRSSHLIDYIDHRLFYIINIACMIFLASGVFLFISTTRRLKIIGSGIVLLLIVVQLIMLFNSNNLIKSVTSLSPDRKNVLSIKENLQTTEVVYYRPYFGIIGRPEERLRSPVKGDFKVEWLANDAAAVTYQTVDNNTQQFIATYGDRGGGTSYYYVGAELHGTWQGENVQLVSDTEGISITTDGESEHFEWDDIHQFGTLAIVLEKNNEAAWTVSLDENFQVNEDTPERQNGNITLYQATMNDNEPIELTKQIE